MASFNGDPNGMNSMAVPSHITQALHIVHNSHSSNDRRQHAQQFLEEVKHMPEAPSHGHDLAANRNNDPVIRHYALSLLEHAIKHKWAEYSTSQATVLCDWVLQLSRDIKQEDPIYIRNKIGQLWVEVAKRSWMDTWNDMDALLVQLWHVPDSAAHKDLVLLILEILSDAIFNNAEDPVVAVREDILSRSCIEIFTPADVLQRHFPHRDTRTKARCGDEGWLSRTATLLRQCLAGDVQNNSEMRDCAIRALAVLNAMMRWSIPNSLTVTGCIPVLCDALRASDVAVQKAALDAMHAFYSRSNLGQIDFIDLVVPLYDTKCIELFVQLYHWSRVDAQDIDEDKYQFGKKFSEMISFVGNYLDRRFEWVPTEAGRVDFPGLLQLLLLLTQDDSFMLSIPVLITWTRLLHHETIGGNICQVPEVIGPLLELCSSRLVRYEMMPEGKEDRVTLFLREDTDTLPERHIFLGNYRRYCVQVIDRIVQLKTTEAMQHILRQAEHSLAQAYEMQRAFHPASFSRASAAFMRVDAQTTVLEAALRGFQIWRMDKEEEDDTKQNAQLVALDDTLASWATNLLGMNFEDPQIMKRVLQLLVAFSSALENKPDFTLKVLEHILVTWPASHPEHAAYSEAVKELQHESTAELQRLAACRPDDLINVYDQIAAKVGEMMASGEMDSKRQSTLQTFLFTIIHRSSRLDSATKAQRLQEFMMPMLFHWQNESLKTALSSHQGFCEMMAFDKAQRYLARYRLHEIRDWGSIELDDEGKALQLEIETRQMEVPLRATKALVTCSVDRLGKDSTAFGTSCEVWRDCVPVILPELLKFLSHAHACHSAEKWTGLPDQMRSIVGRILTDRFWQVGISEGTKEEFYARVSDKRHTIEGLASTIRGAIRYVREAAYAVIYHMSRMHMLFYRLSDLPGPLAQALLAGSSNLSPHQLIHLVNLLKCLVDNCPVELRDSFLPDLLGPSIQQIDDKITAEWMKLEHQQTVPTGSDALTEEMKAESILRQATHTSVVVLTDLLDPGRPVMPLGPSRAPDLCMSRKSGLRTFFLMQQRVIEPLLVFCTHAIRIRDSRSCGVVLRSLRLIVPAFTVANEEEDEAGSDGMENWATERVIKSKRDGTSISPERAHIIREYISSNIVRACIESIHEPYFVELQKDFAALIATIIFHYQGLTQTPRLVLLSLPSMKETEVDRAIQAIRQTTVSVRHQRAVVLDLLRDLKGVSVSEMGKLQKSVTETRKPKRANERSEFQQKLFVSVPPYVPDPVNGTAKTEEALEGVAALF